MKDQDRYCFACGGQLHPTKPHDCPESIHGITIENDPEPEFDPITLWTNGQLGKVFTLNLVPLGVEPERIWKLKRRHALAEAMNRYIDQGVEIPLNWLEEYNKLNKEIDDAWL